MHKSIFIYPAPTEVVEDWLELYVVHKPVDLTENSTESDIEISPEYHSIMANGMKPYIYQSQGKLNEAQAASQVYDSGIIKMTSSMKQRYNQKQKKDAFHSCHQIITINSEVIYLWDSVSIFG